MQCKYIKSNQRQCKARSTKKSEYCFDLNQSIEEQKLIALCDLIIDSYLLDRKNSNNKQLIIDNKDINC